MLPSEAVICVVPAPTPKAKPDCAPMLATAELDEVQLTLEEISCDVPSLNVPTAVN